MDRGGTGHTSSLSVRRTEQGLQVRGLCKQLGAVAALSDVGFEVSAGEVFGLLGPNGAGKTTTVELLVGLRAPDAGSVHVCGIDLCADPRAAKRHLGVALQTTGLQDDITVREALTSFGALFGGGIAADSLLQRFGLAPQANSRVSRLSGGQQQRVALALALVNDPHVIVLDEPTVGLDAQMRREFHDDIRRLREDGRALLLTTHDMDEAAQLCDRIAVIDRGRIVATGSPNDLIASTQRATRVAISTDRSMEPAWFTPVELFAGLRCDGTRVTFATADARAALTRVCQLCAGHELQIVQLQMGKGSLEDAILELVTPQARS